MIWFLYSSPNGAMVLNFCKIFFYMNIGMIMTDIFVWGCLKVQVLLLNFCKIFVFTYEILVIFPNSGFIYLFKVMQIERSLPYVANFVPNGWIGVG